MNLKQKLTIPATILSLSVALISGFEGRRLRAYLDVNGTPTICDGATSGVHIGDTATPKQCDARTRQAIENAYRIFSSVVPKTIELAMTNQAISAYLSFIYNVGPGKKGVKDGFIWLKNGRHSTMLRELQAGHFKQACHQFPLWNTAGGIVYRGLTIRRQKEMKLCLTGLK